MSWKEMILDLIVSGDPDALAITSEKLDVAIGLGWITNDEKAEILAALV